MLNTNKHCIPSPLLPYPYLLVKKELGGAMQLKRKKRMSCIKSFWSYHELGMVLVTSVHHLLIGP